MRGFGRGYGRGRGVTLPRYTGLRHVARRAVQSCSRLQYPGHFTPKNLVLNGIFFLLLFFFAFMSLNRPTYPNSFSTHARRHAQHQQKLSAEAFWSQTLPDRACVRVFFVDARRAHFCLGHTLGALRLWMGFFPLLWTKMGVKFSALSNASVSFGFKKCCGKFGGSCGKSRTGGSLKGQCQEC